MITRCGSDTVRFASTLTYMKTKNIIQIALGTLLVLLIPLVAMQFTDEVNWSGSDFLIMGVLLFGTGLLFNWVIRRFPHHRVVAGGVVILAFLYIWAELAVGVFTNLGS